MSTTPTLATTIALLLLAACDHAPTHAHESSRPHALRVLSASSPPEEIFSARDVAQVFIGPGNQVMIVLADNYTASLRDATAHKIGHNATVELYGILSAPTMVRTSLKGATVTARFPDIGKLRRTLDDEHIEIQDISHSPVDSKTGGSATEAVNHLLSPFGPAAPSQGEKDP